MRDAGDPNHAQPFQNRVPFLLEVVGLIACHACQRRHRVERQRQLVAGVPLARFVDGCVERRTCFLQPAELQERRTAYAVEQGYDVEHTLERLSAAQHLRRVGECRLGVALQHQTLGDPCLRVAELGQRRSIPVLVPGFAEQGMSFLEAPRPRKQPSEPDSDHGHTRPGL